MLLLDEQCSALIAVHENSLNGLSESSLAHLGERSTEDAKVVLRCCQDYIESFGPALALSLPAVSYRSTSWHVVAWCGVAGFTAISLAACQDCPTHAFGQNLSCQVRDKRSDYDTMSFEKFSLVDAW
ncbi:hypothetical protein SeLEV6574_g01476 [Synchytrium endobioticum]|uniref:Uncharacterized protein n=1 Tax=Synchytrium endobioticum TaxID=286115 RepID=A0A507DF24_9FUNG|nr:hypothetical protein SeLEV6574_g01476 [Synchytrium endobioticum]